MNFRDLHIDHTWTLFLDRDGVINRRIVGDYVRTPKQFEPLPGAIDAIATLSSQFRRLIIVTNQRGVGRGLMSEESLGLIHARLINLVNQAGGHIDAIYFAPDLEDDPEGTRKPAPGMAMNAQHAFPDIDFTKSIMVGDSISDMLFGHNLGMVTVLVGDKENNTPPEAHFRFATLDEFSKSLMRRSGLPGGSGDKKP